MKIIRGRLVQPSKTPKKKALLIGINYTSQQQGESAHELRGPHRDVTEMKDFIISTYGYEAKNIVVMLDKNEEGLPQPTRFNILREIKNLVQGAAPGDHFFFHYAGHSTQIPSKNNSEEDGMDECIMSSDEKLIVDNELKKHLVDTLPVGSRLVAIFDSCHSASMLDLEHIRCNRVYVPWLSKGRRKSDFMRNGNVRRQAMIHTRHVYQNTRTTFKTVKSRKTSIDRLLNTPIKQLSVVTKSLSMRSDIVTSEFWFDSPSLAIERCTSPDSLWSCNGFCDHNHSGRPKEADVIALAACKDDQVSWEDSDGTSMTAELIKILKNNPHPSHKDLLTQISHSLHGLLVRIHKTNRAYKLENKNYEERKKAWEAAAGHPAPPLESSSTSNSYIAEIDNFQDPQLASHRPLDMNAPWSL